MSTSLLYHAWGVRGYRYRRTEYDGGMIHFHVEQDPGSFRCACCGSTEVMKSGVVPRQFRSLPIGGKTVWIDLPIQRLPPRTIAMRRSPRRPLQAPHSKTENRKSPAPPP